MASFFFCETSDMASVVPMPFSFWYTVSVKIYLGFIHYSCLQGGPSTKQMPLNPFDLPSDTQLGTPDLVS
jgi:hypothetical protein